MNTLEMALGALVHDIGKFMQRAHAYKRGLSQQSLNMEGYLCPQPDTYVHVLYTNEFAEQFLPTDITGLDKSIIANLASYHHRPDSEDQRIVAEADRLSSGMERVPEDESIKMPTFRKVRLRSIAASITLEGAPAASPLRADVPLGHLSPQSAFPELELEERVLTPDYARLWNAFLEAWKLNQCSQPLDYINRTASVLESFTWSIPSATNVLPDISLYDHLKTTSAIAVCLFNAGSESEDPFLLVTGELSGIQRHIYDIHQGAGRHARRLRARSFEISTYSEAISLEILNRLRLPITHRVLMAAGSFQLLLPNTAGTLECINQVGVEVARWLHEKSTGELGLSLAWTKCGREGLRDFAALSEQAHRKLREERNRAGSAAMVGEDGWSESAFVLDALRFNEGEGLCQCCRKRVGALRTVRESKVHVCYKCEEEGTIGALLPRARYIAFYGDREARRDAPAGGYDLIRDGDRVPGAPRLVIKLGNVEGAEPSLPVVSAMRARTIPVNDDGEVLTFEELAAKSRGREALAWLKLDVDNLGLIFGEGLRQEGLDRVSISRLATLSRTLELFFSGYVEHLLSTEHKYIYVVYSGGDDLLAAGPWDGVFDFAERVRQEFRRFTAGNENWSLSAGIALVGSHTPVLSAVELVDELLEASKSLPGDGVLPYPPDVDTAGAPNKARLTAFGTSIPWSMYPDILANAKRLREWISAGVLHTGQVRRLLNYATMYRRFQKTRKTDHLQYAPLLVRDIRRTWRQKTEDELEAAEWAGGLAAPDSQDMKALRFVCEYALNGVRSSKTKED